MKKRQVKMEERRSLADRWRTFKHFIVTVLVIALILYIAAFFAVRTDGFRYMVEERLRENWAWPVTLERVWLNPDLSLVLVGIDSEGFEDREGAGIVIREARVSWSLARLLHPRRNALRAVEVYDGLFAFQADSAGAWQPIALHADAALLAEWCGITVDQPPEDTRRYLHNEVEVRVMRTDLYAWNRNNELVWSVQGLTFESDQATLLDRTFRLQRIAASSVYDGARTLGDVFREFLWMDGRALDVE
jgi:hypothetical protein